MSDYGRLRTAMQTAGLAKFLLFTDLRLRLVYPATDGSETLGQPDDLVKYYYAIADIQVIAGLNFTFLSLLWPYGTLHYALHLLVRLSFLLTILCG